MKQIIRLIRIFSIFILSISCKQDQSIKESSFCKSQVTGQYVLDANEGWWHWCMAPIYDENGKLHVFMSAIPNSGNWSRDSKIVHYTADKPEGPYVFVDTTFSSNTAAYHNPQVSKVGDTYVLVYLLKNNMVPNSKQEVGIATTKTLEGPWVESPYNPIIRAEGKMNGYEINHASNPTFLVAENGKYRIYFKSMTDQYKPKAYREISLAMSDNIEGPYENYANNPLISYADSSIDIEDPCAFYYKGMYYMIVEDRTGVKDMLEGVPMKDRNTKAGGWRPGLIYTSRDGIDWGRPEIGYQTNTFFFKDKLARTERPHILWKNGEPECLFLACHDEYPSAGFFVRIEGWK